MTINRRELLVAAAGAGLVATTSASARELTRGRSAGHVVLLGDSIFDNKKYVGSKPAVIDQLRAGLPNGWKATLLAVDGSVTRNVAGQVSNIPRDATHLIVSVGGNDALGQARILSKRVSISTEVFLELARIRDEFEKDYNNMLSAVLAKNKPTVVCTVYDPNFSQALQQKVSKAGLTVFNDCITRAAGRQSIPLLDLRLLFTAREDYANPIEPSPVGGAKIVQKIRSIVTNHDFSKKQSVVFA